MKVWQILVTDRKGFYYGSILCDCFPSKDRLKSYLDWLSVCEIEDTEYVLSQYPDEFQTYGEVTYNNICVEIGEKNVIGGWLI